MRFSPQQDDVFNWARNGKGSALVVSVAGSGKTTTLVELVTRLSGSVAFAAYNTKIASEIKAKIEARGVGSNVRAGTFHSFGLGAWRRVAPKVRVEEKKVINILRASEVPESYHAFVREAVSLAKQRAFGVLCPIESREAWLELVEHFDLRESLTDDVGMDADQTLNDALDAAKKVFYKSAEMCTTEIDFDDMIFAPLYFNARMWQNDWVLIDEAQDTNPARRALAKKMLRPGGRLVAVGDPHQAIYGFTGADNDSLDIIRREFSCVELPLTVTYRCPKSVVSVARQWVSHIEAHESAPEGIVKMTTLPEWEKTWTELRNTDAVLCRNTKPLVQLAYSMIRKGIPCHVEGKDIGKGLMALANKWKFRDLESLADRLSEYKVRETERLMAKGQEVKAEALADRIETLQVIIDSLPSDSTSSDLYAQINKLFGDVAPGQPSPNLTLSTVHKSKGREWERVYLLGRSSYMPSRYARQEWQLEQEINLMYVAVTRAKAELTDVVLSSSPSTR